jgi:penicillin-binding protein 2
MLEDGGFGYASMHCSGLHGTVDLHQALRSSCNAYFAQVGELCYTPRGMADMARAFGFGESTGVQIFGRTDQRTGLREDTDLEKPLEEATQRAYERMRAANGLHVVEATPMQVARATAGIATGRLPDMRFVESIGGELLPLDPGTEVEVSERNLALVREAMRAVVTDSRGSANGKGLDEASLGFTVALKTGSADFLPFEPGTDPRFGTASERRGRMRKHTWIAGWFPAEAPRAVFVVYVHDAAETSSHTAVHVARQFLSNPAVGAWLAQQGGRQ